MVDFQATVQSAPPVVPIEYSIHWPEGQDQVVWAAMIAFMSLILHVMVSPMDDDGRWFACARSLDQLATWLAQCVARRSGKDCRCCSPTSMSSNPPKRIFTTSLDQSRRRHLCGRVHCPCGQQARFPDPVPYGLRGGAIPAPFSEMIVT
jgi:hypothetical protein